VEVDAAADALVTLMVDEVTVALTERTVTLSGKGAAMTMSVPVETPADAVAAELRALASDRVLVAAIEALAEMFPR
jgi:hypothetical protein